MGNIVDFEKLANGKIKCYILTDLKNALFLQGNFKDVFLFSPRLCNTKTRVIEIGIKKSTKYFEIPRKLALKKPSKKIRLNQKVSISCQRIETRKQHIFVYTIPRCSIDRKYPWDVI